VRSASSQFRTVERAIVATILTTVPMIDSTIEWSALPLPQCRCSSLTICRREPMWFKQFAVIDETLLQARTVRDRVGTSHPPAFCSPHHSGSALYPKVQRMEPAAGFEIGDDVPARLTARAGRGPPTCGHL
jgi:hypothetical protein